MKHLAIIFWPKGGSVERTAQMIKERITEFKTSIDCIEDAEVLDLAKADFIIAGGSTVGADNWTNRDTQNEWPSFFNKLSTEGISLENKNGAIFGLGNQLLYPDHFVDSMADLKAQLEFFGLNIVGDTDIEGYDFEGSRAVVNGRFLGLAIDEDFQPELTEERIDNWLESLSEYLK